MHKLVGIRKGRATQQTGFARGSCEQHRRENALAFAQTRFFPQAFVLLAGEITEWFGILKPDTGLLLLPATGR